MQLPVFKLERFFAEYEFTAPYLLCCSDCESFSVEDLFALEPEAGKTFKKQWLGYTESKGHPVLREQISSLYDTVNPEDVLVHSGAEEAIFNFMYATLNRGDHVIIQYPCYQSLISVPEAIGCRVTRWEMVPGEKGWRLDFDALEHSLGENTKAIIVNSPHNPTGYLFTLAELQQLLDLAGRKNIRVFSDEVYRYLEYDPRDRLPWVCDLYENAVSLGVMSKSFGLAGLRIGWIATHNKDIYQKMAAFKDYTTICNSAPSEYFAMLALRNREKILARNMAIIKHNLTRLGHFFNRYRQFFDWYAPHAGPVAFPRLKINKAVTTFCTDLVRNKGVLLLPASCFDYAQPHFRIGYGRSNVGECLTKLEEYLQEEFEQHI